MNFSKPTPYEIDPSDKTETAEVLVRFTNWRARSKVYGLKFMPESNLRANLDLTKFRSEMLTRMRKTLFDKKLRAYAYINGECKVILNDCSGEGDKIFIDGWDHLMDVIESIRVDPTFYKSKPRRQNARRD